MNPTTTHIVQRFEDGFTLGRPAVEFGSEVAAHEYVASRTDKGRNRGVSTYYVISEA